MDRARAAPPPQFPTAVAFPPRDPPPEDPPRIVSRLRSSVFSGLPCLMNAAGISS